MRMRNAWIRRSVALLLALLLPFAALSTPARAEEAGETIVTGTDIPEDPVIPEDPDEPVRTLSVSGPARIRGGEKAYFTAWLDGVAVDAEEISWALSPYDTSIATVSDGVVSTKRVQYLSTMQVTAVYKRDTSLRAATVLSIVPGVKNVLVVAPDTYLDLTSGRKMRLSAVCEPEDSIQTVTWSANNDCVAVDADGWVTPLRTGTVTVTARATDGTGVAGSIKLHVVSGVTGLTIEGPDHVAAGRSVTLTAKVLPEDATVPDIEWSVNCESDIATIYGGRFTAKNIEGVATVTVKAASVQDPSIYATHQVTIRPATTRVEINAPQTFVDLLAGTNPTLQLTAVCKPMDASQQVQWTSSNPAVATVDAKGLVTAHRGGSTVITASATDGSGKYAAITIDVVKAVRELTIQGANRVASGSSIALTVSVQPEDATHPAVNWYVDCDPAIATINADGVLSAKGGLVHSYPVTVTAVSKEDADVFATWQVTVVPAASKIVITAPVDYIDLNSDVNTLQLTAACEPAEALQGVTWRSMNPEIASVDENGLVKGLRQGSAVIVATASDGSGREGSFTVRVLCAAEGLRIEGPAALASGYTAQLRVVSFPEGTEAPAVTWSTDFEEAIAFISQNGMLYAAAGLDVPVKVTVTATSVLDPTLTATHQVLLCPAVTKVNMTADADFIDLNSGVYTLQMQASCEPSIALQDVEWLSSDPYVAMVDQNGLVTGLKAGQTTIIARAKDGTGRYASMNVKVLWAVKGLEISGTQVLGFGCSAQLKATVTPADATEQTIRWWVDVDEQIATISATGLLSAKAGLVQPVTVKVSAQSTQDPTVVATHTVELLPPVRTVNMIFEREFIDLTSEDKTLQLTASCNPASACQQVKWATSNPKVATVDANGLVTGVSQGNVVITATAVDGTGKSARFTVRVLDAVESVSISGPTEIGAGKSVKLNATVLPASATDDTVIWQLDCPVTVANISQSGVVTAQPLDRPYTVTATAVSSQDATKRGEWKMTILPHAVQQVKLAPVARDWMDVDAPEETLSLSATCLPADASQHLTWTSSDPEVAWVDQNGTVHARSIGVAVIRATAADGSGCYASQTIRVEKPVTALKLTAVADRLTAGKSLLLRCTVTPEDATATRTTWSVNCDASVATVVNGVLTARNVTKEQTVTVTVASADNPAVSATLDIVLEPAK